MLFANAYNFSKISACVDDANWNNGAKQKKGDITVKIMRNFGARMEKQDQDRSIH